jgi:3-deoxy-D-manno-octulosonic-acid transferase
MHQGGIFLYYIAAFLSYIVSLPLVVVSAFKSKYKTSIPKRFFPFFSGNKAFNNGGIWFHVCSFGEARAIAPIIDIFKESQINISVITQTGFNEALKYKADVRYLPFEIFIPFWINKNNKALIVFEAELWLLPFYIMKKNNKKTILLNARISDKSYQSYKKAKWFYRFIFKFIDTTFAQSQIDKDRLQELGAKNIEVIGNIKMFQQIKIKHKYQKPNSLIITAGSTHELEEEMIVKAFMKFKKGKLIIVPRHPERFDKIDKLIQNLIKNQDFSYHRFSNKQNFSSDIVLFDKMGELNEIYAISDIVILGGAFNKNIGGHNPLEPEFFKCKLICGKHIFNQKAIFSELKNVIFADENQESILQALNQALDFLPVEIKNRPDIKKIQQKIYSTIF